MKDVPIVNEDELLLEQIIETYKMVDDDDNPLNVMLMMSLNVELSYVQDFLRIMPNVSAKEFLLFEYHYRKQIQVELIMQVMNYQVKMWKVLYELH